METFAGLFALYAALLAIIYLVFRSFRPNPEPGQQPLYILTIGRTFDGIGIYWPLVLLALYGDHLVISDRFRKVILPYDDIDNVELARHLIGKHVFIRHHNADAPKQIMLIPLFGNLKLKDIIERTIANKQASVVGDSRACEQ